MFNPKQIQKMLEETDKENDLDNDALRKSLAEASNLDNSTIKTGKVSINDSPSMKKIVEP